MKIKESAWQMVWEKENSLFKPVMLLLKINFVSNPVRGVGVWYMHISYTYDMYEISYIYIYDIIHIYHIYIYTISYIYLIYVWDIIHIYIRYHTYISYIYIYMISYIYIIRYMRKTSGKVDKSITYNRFSNNILFFPWIKNEILPLNLLKLFALSTFLLIFIILSDSPKSTISTSTSITSLNM